MAAKQIKVINGEVNTAFESAKIFSTQIPMFYH
jgi:hypothetical protein